MSCWYGCNVPRTPRFGGSRLWDWFGMWLCPPWESDGQTKKKGAPGPCLFWDLTILVLVVSKEFQFNLDGLDQVQPSYTRLKYSRLGRTGLLVIPLQEVSGDLDSVTRTWCMPGKSLPAPSGQLVSEICWKLTGFGWPPPPSWRWPFSWLTVAALTAASYK